MDLCEFERLREKFELQGDPDSTYLISLIYFYVFETGSPCRPSRPGTHSVDQAGLELTRICLPLPPKC